MNQISNKKAPFEPSKVELFEFDESVIVTSGNGIGMGTDNIIPTEQTWEW